MLDIQLIHLLQKCYPTRWGLDLLEKGCAMTASALILFFLINEGIKLKLCIIPTIGIVS